MKTKIESMRNTNRVFEVPFIVREKVTEMDENGIEHERWQAKYKLFADGANLYGREYETARQTTNDKTVKFIVKHGAKIDETMTILFNGQVYDIENVDNIRYKNELVEIRATRKRVRK